MDQFFFINKYGIFVSQQLLGFFFKISGYNGLANVADCDYGKTNFCLEVPWRNRFLGKLNKAFLYFFGIFDVFSKLSRYAKAKALRNFEKSHFLG